MTDRFKFRVWNKRDKLYEDIDDLYSYCIRQDGTFHLTEDGGCDINIDVNDYIIEQCTGLKDKNGNLIYENDLFKDDDFISRVIYKEGCFMLETIDLTYAEGDYDYSSINLTCYNKLSIAGNIHENPELWEV